MAGKLTTHVLDTAQGKPGAGIGLTLSRLDGETPTLITSTTTNSDGRTDEPMLSGDAMQKGLYELHFAVGDYFKNGLWENVPVRFRIEDVFAHYHIPLLCSPWSYSTYRGS